jgi:SAM-dependent methyltransferase
LFLEESLWIRDQLSRADLPAGSRALDVGSSNREVRTVVQPWIDANIFAPLRERGVEPVHLDFRQEDGVDVICDITAPDADPLEAAGGRRFELVICGNLLEHVVDRPTTIGRLRELVAPGGLLLVTVPHRYKEHHDPIDTMFRPSPGELVAEIADGHGHWEPLATDVIDVRGRATHDTAPIPIRLWLENVRWAIKPLRWQQACVVLRKLQT